MTTARDEIKKQICDQLTGGEFPITSFSDLMVAFPMGAQTVCKFEEVEVEAGVAEELLTDDDYPFASAEEVAELMVFRAGL